MFVLEFYLSKWTIIEINCTFLCDGSANYRAAKPRAVDLWHRVIVELAVRFCMRRSKRLQSHFSQRLIWMVPA